MAAVSRSRTTLPAASGRAGFSGTLRSELTKLGSVASTYWTLAAMFTVAVVIGAVLSVAVAVHWHQSTKHVGFDAAQLSLVGMLLAGRPLWPVPARSGRSSAAPCT